MPRGGGGRKAPHQAQVPYPVAHTPDKAGKLHSREGRLVRWRAGAKQSRMAQMHADRGGAHTLVRCLEIC